MNLFIGAHVSISGGLHLATQRAAEIGANCFGMFLKNQRQWLARTYKLDEIDLFKQSLEQYGFNSDKILPHSGYLINLGTVEDEIRKKSLNAFIDELVRADQLGLKYLNIHPGNHKGLISEKDCLKLIASNINCALEKVERVKVVLENTAGQGSAVGYRFEHLRDIIDQVKEKDRVGCCFDTCHAFAAGYDISTPEGFAQVLEEFSQIIGQEKLWAAHINDTKNVLGTRVDRHQNLGQGKLSEATFRFLINSPTFQGIPLILETIDETLWKKEISWLFSLKINKIEGNDY